MVGGCCAIKLMSSSWLVALTWQLLIPVIAKFWALAAGSNLVVDLGGYVGMVSSGGLVALCDNCCVQCCNWHGLWPWGSRCSPAHVVVYIAPALAVIAAPAPDLEHIAPDSAVIAVRAPGVELITPAPSAIAAHAPWWSTSCQVLQWSQHVCLWWSCRTRSCRDRGTCAVVECIVPAPAVSCSSNGVHGTVSWSSRLWIIASEKPQRGGERVGDHPPRTEFLSLPTAPFAVRSLSAARSASAVRRSSASWSTFCVNLISYAGPVQFQRQQCVTLHQLQVWSTLLSFLRRHSSHLLLLGLSTCACGGAHRAIASCGLRSSAPAVCVAPAPVVEFISPSSAVSDPVGASWSRELWSQMSWPGGCRLLLRSQGSSRSRVHLARRLRRGLNCQKLFRATLKRVVRQRLRGMNMNGNLCAVSALRVSV